MPARGFVSYSRGDQEFADKLITALRQQGQARGLTFGSDRELKAGESWEDHLQDAARLSDAVIMIMSPAALDSAVMMMELGAAHAAKKPVIAVLPPRRSVDVSSFLPHSRPIKAGTRPIAAVARDVLDRIEELVSTQATA
jgi:hypothetical protein